MQPRKPGRLSQEEVIKLFNKEFTEEYNIIAANIHAVARGSTSFSNNWKEWLGIGAISGSAVLINATFGILVALSVLPGFVALGVGILVGVVGVIAGIAFKRHRNKIKRQRYQQAERFIESELTPDNIEKLRAKIQEQLCPVMLDDTANEISETIKELMAAFAQLIIRGIVKDYSELEKLDIVSLLNKSLENTPIVMINTKLIQTLINKLKDQPQKTPMQIRVKADNKTINDKPTSKHVRFFEPSDIPVSARPELKKPTELKPNL